MCYIRGYNKSKRGKIDMYDNFKLYVFIILLVVVLNYVLVCGGLITSKIFRVVSRRTFGSTNYRTQLIALSNDYTEIKGSLYLIGLQVGLFKHLKLCRVKYEIGSFEIENLEANDTEAFMMLENYFRGCPKIKNIVRENNKIKVDFNGAH